jgi:hypothetical protein
MPLTESCDVIRNVSWSLVGLCVYVHIYAGHRMRSHELLFPWYEHKLIPHRWFSSCCYVLNCEWCYRRQHFWSISWAQAKVHTPVLTGRVKCLNSVLPLIGRLKPMTPMSLKFEVPKLPATTRVSYKKATFLSYSYIRNPMRCFNWEQSWHPNAMCNERKLWDCGGIGHSESNSPINFTAWKVTVVTPPVRRASQLIWMRWPPRCSELTWFYFSVLRRCLIFAKTP